MVDRKITGKFPEFEAISHGLTMQLDRLAPMGDGNYKHVSAQVPVDISHQYASVSLVRFSYSPRRLREREQLPTQSLIILPVRDRNVAHVAYVPPYSVGAHDTIHLTAPLTMLDGNVEELIPSGLSQLKHSSDIRRAERTGKLLDTQRDNVARVENIVRILQRINKDDIVDKTTVVDALNTGKDFRALSDPLIEEITAQASPYAPDRPQRIISIKGQRGTEILGIFQELGLLLSIIHTDRGRIICRAVLVNQEDREGDLFDPDRQVMYTRYEWNRDRNKTIISRNTGMNTIGSLHEAIPRSGQEQERVTTISDLSDFLDTLRTAATGRNVR